MFILLVIAATLATACDRVVAAHERAGTASSSARGSLPAPAASTIGHDAASTASKANFVERRARCLPDFPPEATVERRLELAAKQCGRGLRPRSLAKAFSIAAASSATLDELPAGEARCYRFLAATADSAQSVRLEVRLASGEALAEAQSRGILVLPDDGPLCVPPEAAVVGRLTSPDRAVTGASVVLESP